MLRADAGDRTVRFVLSDGTVDRMDDTVAGSGWDLTAYHKSGGAVRARQQRSSVGRANCVWTDGSRLLGDVEFAPPETYAFADTIYKLVMGGFLKRDRSGSCRSFISSLIARAALISSGKSCSSFSVVPVPANSNALIEAQMKGIVSSRVVRRLLRAADDSPMPPAVIGNCGRPADKECGLKDPSECATHAEGWDGLDGGIGDWNGRELKLHRLIARAKRDRWNAPTRAPANESRAEQLFICSGCGNGMASNGSTLAWSRPTAPTGCAVGERDDRLPISTSAVALSIPDGLLAARA